MKKTKYNSHHVIEVSFVLASEIRCVVKMGGGDGSLVIALAVGPAAATGA